MLFLGFNMSEGFNLLTFKPQDLFITFEIIKFNLLQKLKL